MIYAVLGYEPIDWVVLAAYAERGAVPALVEWAKLYADLCPVAGVRTSVAWAQACHETGRFTYPGDALPSWNNPCGLGVGSRPLIRGGVEVPNSADCKFATKELGARAHLGHLAGVYFSPFELKGFCENDPRHVPHRNLENDGRKLGGLWAPNVEYGSLILTKAMAVLERQV